MWSHLRRDGNAPPVQREPLFIPLWSYLLVTCVLSLALSYQWYISFAGEKTFLSIATVTFTTNFIWAGAGLLIWEMLQAFPLQKGASRTNVLPFAALGIGVLWLQQVRFQFLGGYGAHLSNATYLRSAWHFVARVGLFYLVIYVVLVFVLQGMYSQRRMQRLQLASARLHDELMHAQLHNLRAQIHPHFFFNVLNTISALMHQDLRQADQMIELLSRLMRRNLEEPESEATILPEELKAAEEYLHLHQLRFGPRLRYEIDTTPESLRSIVPRLLLQPLLENCIVHAVERSRETTDVQVRCATRDGKLLLTVSNTDRGPSQNRGFSQGLGSLEKRLRLIYGEAARISAAAAEQEYRVEIVLPMQMTPQPVMGR